MALWSFWSNCQRVPRSHYLYKHHYSLLQRFCTEADARNVLQCLKQNKNSELMDPKCKQMITKRQITQNTGIHTEPHTTTHRVP